MRNRYNIYFSRHKAMPDAEIVKPAILLSPDPDEWNDFHRRTRFFYEVLDPSGKVISGSVHLAFVDNEAEGDEDDPATPAKAVENALEISKKNFIPASSFLPFYTLQFDMNAYREIVRKLGVADAGVFLGEMNDLVAMKWSGKQADWYQQAIGSLDFSLSFIRNAEAFFAFHNAGSILSGLDSEQTGGISKDWRLEFQLAAFRNPHRLNFSFDEDDVIPKRIAVIIGKNGVGKSQALAKFANGLIAGDQHVTDTDGHRPLLNRLIAFSSPGEARNTFPPPRRSTRVDYRRIFLTRNPSGDLLSGLGDVIVRLVRLDEQIKGESRWGLFCRTVSTIAPLDQLVVKVVDERHRAFRSANAQNTISLSTLAERTGEQLRLARWSNVDTRADVYRRVGDGVFPLSSGQLTFIRFAAQACINIENGSMVLFDEPETHLHPNYITDFYRLLDRLLEETGSYAILATHSAYFVREVPSSQVVILSTSQDGFVESSIPRLKTLGADIGAISSFVFGDQGFGDDSFDRIFAGIKSRLKQMWPDVKPTLNRLENEVSAEGMMYLRRSLEDEVS